MPNSYSFSDLLVIFKGAHQTVDLRWAAVRENKRWLLIAMSVHIRVDSGELSAKDFSDNLKRIPAIESSSVRIFQRNCPVEELQRLAHMVLTGRMILDDMEFILSDPRDILKQIASIQPAKNEALWPRLQQEMKLSNENSAAQLFLNDFQFSRVTELAGYKNLDAAVSRLLGVDFNSGSIGGFWIITDVPLRILPLAVSRKGDSLILNVRVEASHVVHNAACAVRISILDREVRDVPVTKLNRLSEEGDVALWHAEIPLLLERGDFLEVDVLNDEAGRLYSRREWASNLLPIELTNPLFAALTMFCPRDQLLSLLAQPETAGPGKRVKLGPESLFEISVQWLLSALGFQALWLHGYEICKEGNVQVGAADCLAYSERENLLLLVNCSLGAPNPVELNKHAAFSTRVSKSFSVNSNVKVLSVLVTATSKPEGKGSESTVIILYKEDLEKLLKAAENGLLVEFSNYTNPIFGGRLVG